MNAAILHTLEFNKILNHLAEQTHSNISREQILKIKPGTNLPAIEQSLSEVSELRAIIEFDDAFPIHTFHDIRPALKKAKIQGNHLEPVEFIRIKQLLLLSRHIISYFHSRSEKYPLLEKLARQIYELTQIEEKITQIIDESMNTVRDNASRELARTRKEIAATQNRIRKKVETIQKGWENSGYLQDSIITSREGRFVLLVKEQHRNRAQGVVHDQSASGATLFMEPIETLELNNRMRRLYLTEKHEIERILTDLTNDIRQADEALETNLRLAVRFDNIFTRAQFSLEINGCQPQLNRENRLHLLTARHPLLILKSKQFEDVVPLSLKMGEDFSTLIISGANAGGKTVALKTIGLLALMVQSGLHIPVFPDSELPVFEEIFADIGDLQSIENDLSTFSSHIQKIKVITENANPQTLVLIDEIGSGTDPEEGVALASAILNKLTTNGCLTVVTTHHGALKAYAFETAGIENGSMQFNLQTLEPSYRFRLGVPGSSYAFEIAQRFGIAPDIIDNARQNIGSGKRKVENLIIDLENRNQKQTELLRELDIKQTQLDGLTKLYQEKVDEHKRERRKLKKRAIEDAEKIVQQANATVEHLIKEIREQKASRPVIQQAKQALAHQRETIEQESNRVKAQSEKIRYRPIEASQIETGQTVLWKKFDSVGTILSPVDSAQKVLIEAGHIKIRVPLQELAQISNKQKKRATQLISTTCFNLPDQISTELDLRGTRVDNALPEIDKFIDKALIAGLHQIRILHGKGTGALKIAVSEFLRNHPSVYGQKEAAWNEGAAGVTVVELKS